MGAAMNSSFLGCAVLFAALATASDAARPDWERGIADSDAEASVYLDPFSLRKEGDLIRIRVLSDLKKADTYLGRPYLSVSSVKEYDCRTAMVRTVEVALYAGPMRSGDLIASDLPNGKEWRPLAAERNAKYLPQRIVSSLRDWICG